MDSRRRGKRPAPQEAQIARLAGTQQAANPPAWAAVAPVLAAGPVIGFAQPAADGKRFNIVGAIDGLIGGSIFGWAYDRDFGRRRVKITMYVDGKFATETTANGLRRELAGKGSHDGFSGFVCTIPLEKFIAGAALRIFADGSELTAAPLILGPKHIDGIFEPIDGIVAGGWVRERTREPTRAALDMVIDGKIVRSVIADRLREELKSHGVGDGCFGFAEPLPVWCLDGGEHEIGFVHRASGATVAPGPRRFRAAYAGALDRLDQYGGNGWVHCRETPGRAIALDIIVNGERVAAVADQSRPDVRAALGFEARGFEFRIPESVSRHREIAVEIFVAGSAIPAIPGPFRFTPMSRVIEQLESFAAEIGHDATVSRSGDRPHSLIRDAIVPNLVAALRSRDRQTGPFELALRIDPAPLPAAAPRLSETVDVVIPVYAGHDETIACIESVIRSVNTTRREIVVVDDCSPEPKLRAALRNFERSGAITLIVNPANLGFPGAANAGMALHPDRDVILLNADTLVSRGWIDRLRSAAYRSDNTGSVTPLSNRATICSYPQINKDNDLPTDIGWEALDELCARVNSAVAIELPTAVGFCAYLKRAMLRETGLLNTERWKRGYGEENELCILAAARGWKHLLAADVFVVHHGAVSFGVNDRRALLETNLGTLNRLYPDYLPRVMEFLREDPVAAARRAIDWARLRRLSTRFMLFVSHRYGGGTAVHVEDMARRLAAEDCHVLILEANADNRGMVTIRNLALGTSSVYSLPGETDTLLADLRTIGIWHIHFHQIMGGERWANLPKELDCPYDVTIHDYSFFCPRIDLIDERRQYCGEPAVEVCERCIALNQPHPQLQDAFRDRGNLREWLRLHSVLLSGARRVFAPSQDVAARMKRHLPDVEYTVRYHPEAARLVAIRRPASGGTARVAVIGAIGANKGYDLLLGCARDALKQGLPIEFNLFGFSEDDTPLRQLANVRLVGEYAREDLARLVAENPCDVALFLSIWPETYCYALSDAYALGLYPIALGFGALKERIAASKVGAVLPLASTLAEINAAIRAEITRADQWPEAVTIGEDDDVLTGYYGLRPRAGEPSPAPGASPRRNKSKQVGSGLR
jgi:GT2 family glycosyltransferase/glycosyltransferase involved in cell wall biosynthesis